MTEFPSSSANPAVASFAQALDAAVKIGPLSQQVDNLVAQNGKYAKEFDAIKRVINQVANTCTRNAHEQDEYNRCSGAEMRKRLDQQALAISEQSKVIKSLQHDLVASQHVAQQQHGELAHLKTNWARLTGALDYQFENNRRQQVEEARAFQKLLHEGNREQFQRLQENIVLPLINYIQAIHASGVLSEELIQSSSAIFSSQQPPQAASLQSNQVIPPRAAASPPSYLPSPQAQITTAPPSVTQAPHNSAFSAILPPEQTAHSQHTTQTPVASRSSALPTDTQMAPSLKTSHAVSSQWQNASSLEPNGIERRSVSGPLSSDLEPNAAGENTSHVVPPTAHRHEPQNCQATRPKDQSRERSSSTDSVVFVSERAPNRRVRPAVGIIKLEPGLQIVTLTETPVSPHTQSIIEPPVQVPIETQVDTPMQVTAEPSVERLLSETRIGTPVHFPVDIVDELQVEMEVDVQPKSNAAAHPEQLPNSARTGPIPHAEPASRILLPQSSLPSRPSQETLTSAANLPSQASSAFIRRDPVRQEASRSPVASDASAVDPKTAPYTAYVYYGDCNVPVTPTVVYDDHTLSANYISRKLADILVHKGYAQRLPYAQQEKITVELHLRCNELLATKTGAPRAPGRQYFRLPGVEFEVRPRCELAEGAIVGHSVFVGKNLSIKPSQKRENGLLIVQNGTGQGAVIFPFPDTDLLKHYSNKYSQACRLAECAIQRLHSRSSNTTGNGSDRNNNDDAGSSKRSGARSSLNDSRDSRYTDPAASDLLSRLDYQSENLYKRPRNRASTLDGRLYEDRQHRYDNYDDDSRDNRNLADRRSNGSGATSAARLQSPTRQQRYAGRAERDYDYDDDRDHRYESEPEGRDSPLTDMSSDFIVEEVDEEDDELELTNLPLAQRILPEREIRRVQQEKRLARARRGPSAESDNESSAEEPLVVRTRRRP